VDKGEPHSGSPFDRHTFGVGLDPLKCFDPVEIPIKTDNLGERKLSHHDSMIRIGKGDVFVDVQAKDVPKFALAGKHNTG
jgi:hypothetical protein